MKAPDYSHFYNFSEIEEYILSAAAKHPDYMRVETLAVTEQGRNFYLVTLSDFKSGKDPSEKGAFYMQAGIHAGEVAGETAALTFLYTVLTDERALALLKDITIYIAPCVNPDGVDYAVTKSAAIRSKMLPLADIPNALVPDDVDGDGRILTMRWPDPLGKMKPLPEHPEFLVAREPGDREGVFYSTCVEGYMRDYEGKEPVFATRSIDFNRQYPCEWRDTESGGGYPGRFIETRTIIEFLVTHPNIYAAVDMHCGPAGFICNTPENLQDSELIKRVALLGEEMTGIPVIAGKDYHHIYKKAHNPQGSLRSFSYDSLGISFYTIELGVGYNNLGMSTKEILGEHGSLASPELRRRLAEYHAEKGSVVCFPWRPFDHPQLGKVEIGGMKNGQGHYMYPPDMEEVTKKVASFLVRFASMRPELRFGNLERLDLGGGIYRIRAELMNVGELGTKVMQGSAGYNAQQDIKVRLTGPAELEVLSRPATYVLGQLKAVEKASFEWFVRAPSGGEVTVTAVHPKAGIASGLLKLN